METMWTSDFTHYNLLAVVSIDEECNWLIATSLAINYILMSSNPLMKTNRESQTIEVKKMQKVPNVCFGATSIAF